MNDMQYTPSSPRVFYTTCSWCHQFPADHHQEDCPRRSGKAQKLLSHLNPCFYCKMNKPDHYGRHCHMKPLFKEYNMDRVWKYDKCFYCHHDHPDHPGRKCPQFDQYWKDMETARARSRSRAATTASILQDGFVDAANPEPTPSSLPSYVAPSSSSSSSSSGSDLPSVLHAHIPIGEIRIFPCAQKSCNRLAAQGFVNCCKYCSSSSGVNHSSRCEPRENFINFAFGHKR